jgi:hypothetical protein
MCVAENNGKMDAITLERDGATSSQYHGEMTVGEISALYSDLAQAVMLHRYSEVAPSQNSVGNDSNSHLPPSE